MSSTLTVIEFNSGLFSSGNGPGEGVDLANVVATCLAAEAACLADLTSCNNDVTSIAGSLQAVIAAGATALTTLNTAVTAAEGVLAADVATATGSLSASVTAAATSATAAAASQTAAATSATAASTSQTLAAASATAAAASATSVSGSVTTVIAAAAAAASSATIAQAAASAAEAAAAEAEAVAGGELFPDNCAYLLTDGSGAAVGGTLGVGLTQSGGGVLSVNAPVAPFLLGTTGGTLTGGALGDNLVAGTVGGVPSLRCLPPLSPCISFPALVPPNTTIAIPMPVPYSIPANLAGIVSYVGTGSAAVASFPYSISSAGTVTSLGTIVVSGAVVAVSGILHAGPANDTLLIETPITQDAALALLSFTLSIGRT